MTPIIIEKVQLKASSEQSIVEFCKQNNVKPVAVITTKPNGYQGVQFVDLTNPNEGFCVLLGNSTYAGETISRDWTVYRNKAGIPRISHVAKQQVEWA